MQNETCHKISENIYVLPSVWPFLNRQMNPQVGNHRLKCRNGAWSGQFPVCTGDDYDDDDDHDDDDDALHELVAEPSCL